MAFLTVKDNCGGDGVCAEVCPVGILKMDPEKKIPVPIEGAEDICIRCGHCVAVCPLKALSLDTIPVEDCPDLPRDWRLTPEQVRTFLKGRRTIRKYSDKPVDKDVIEDIIDTARYAPSGINLQPVRYAVVHGPQAMSALRSGVLEWARGLVKAGHPIAQKLHLKRAVDLTDQGADYFCRSAPHAVLAYAIQEDKTAPQACTIAAAFLDLAAVSHGLGTCWAGYVILAVNMVPELKKAAGIPRQCDCFAAMLLGRPQVRFRRIPTRNRARIVWR